MALALAALFFPSSYPEGQAGELSACVQCWEGRAAIGRAAPFSRRHPAEDDVSCIQESVKPRLRDQGNSGRDAKAETPRHHWDL